MADYIAALWQHWASLMSGVVSLLVGIALRVSRRFSVLEKLRDIPDWLFITVGLICLFWSGYRAWSDEHAKVLAVSKPFFKISEPGIKPLPKSPPFRMQITMENTGGRPAYDLSGKVVIVDQKFLSMPVVSEFSIGNEVPPGSPTPWYTDTVVIPPEANAMYVVYAIKYLDKLDGNIQYRQVWYMKWSGAQHGLTQPDFTYVSVQERDYIFTHLKAELKGFAE